MTADVIAPTAQGRRRGDRDGQALWFLGVPYAESPATAGRFAAPAPPVRWDGIREALSYGATSPQPDRGITLIPEPIIVGDNELNLNVFTPDLGAAGPPKALAAGMHGALVRFVTEGDPGWARHRADRWPVMVFAEPSAVQEDPLQLERAAWMEPPDRPHRPLSGQAPGGAGARE